MKQLYKRAIYTAKQNVLGTVESSQPINSILAKHSTINKENIKLLMYRLSKMLQFKQDASKILKNLIEAEHSFDEYKMPANK